MKTYIALTLIYDRRLTRVDPETSDLVEHGYVQVGETIALEDDSAAILLEKSYIAEIDQIADMLANAADATITAVDDLAIGLQHATEPEPAE